MELYILAVLIQPILFIISYLIIGSAIYICEEANHGIRNFIHSVRQTWWDVEWKLNHRR